MKPYLNFNAFLILLCCVVYAYSTPVQDLEILYKKAIQLENEGKLDSAILILDGVLGQKPRIISLLDSIDQLEVRWMRQANINPEQIQAWKKHVEMLQILKSDYRLIKPVIDSIKSSIKSDSLWLWCADQETLALERTRAKIGDELTLLKTRTIESGKYDLFREKLLEMEALPIELKQGFPIDELLLWVEQQQVSEAQFKDSLFWTTNDPKEIIKIADQYFQKGRFKEARELFLKLLGTSLRPKALSMLPKVAEKGCANDRKQGADFFALWKKKAQQADLVKAIEALDRCLSGFPEHPQKETLLRNKAMLEADLK